MTLPPRWSALDTAAAPAWAELTNLLATVEGTEEFYSADDLAEELEEPGFDAARDSWAVWHGETMIAFGQLRIGAELVDNRWCQAYLDGGVHPQWRRRGIGTALMDRMEARARELAAQRHPDAPLRLRVPGRLDGDPVRPLLTGRGYAIARYFTDMEAEVPRPGRPDPARPDPATTDPGPRVQPYQPAFAERIRLAHNEAFADHWGSTPRTAEEWRGWLGSRTFRPDTSVICLDEHGEVLAYVLSYQWVDGELHIGQVGTRPRARGRGLARACLEATVRAAEDSGRYHRLDLSVDSINPTGAIGLYQAVGFHPVRTMAAFVREDDAGSAT